MTRSARLTDLRVFIKELEVAGDLVRVKAPVDPNQEITDQVLTFSENRMVVDAMRQFREYFRSFRTENAITPYSPTGSTRG